MCRAHIPPISDTNHIVTAARNVSRKHKIYFGQHMYIQTKHRRRVSTHCFFFRFQFESKNKPKSFFSSRSNLSPPTSWSSNGHERDGTRERDETRIDRYFCGAYVLRSLYRWWQQRLRLSEPCALRRAIVCVYACMRACVHGAQYSSVCIRMPCGVCKVVFNCVYSTAYATVKLFSQDRIAQWAQHNFFL